MNMIAKLKTWPLLAALLTGLTLAPTLSMAGTNNERNERAQHSHQQAKHNGKHSAQRRDQHRHHHVNHYRVNRAHHGHAHHPARTVCRDRNHHHARHGHQHTIVRNSYRQPIYVSGYPRITLGLHGDNFDIIYRDR